MMNLHIDWSFIQQGNGLILIGGLVFVAALFMLARMIGNWIQSFSRRRQSFSRRQRFGVWTSLIMLLSCAVLIFLATSLVMAGVSFKTYVTFTRADHIGQVECLAWHPQEKFMVIAFKELVQGRTVSSRTYSLYGDQWDISARIIKWDPRLNLLGLHTGYRLHQIKGSYQEAADETMGQHRAYALHPGQDWLWWLLNVLEGKLPLVEAVYGNAVSQTARPGEVFDIFVTTSGLSLRKHQP